MKQVSVIVVATVSPMVQMVMIAAMDHMARKMKMAMEYRMDRTVIMFRPLMVLVISMVPIDSSQTSRRFSLVNETLQ